MNGSAVSPHLARKLLFFCLFACLAPTSIRIYHYDYFLNLTRTYYEDFSLFLYSQLHLKGNYYIYTVSLKTAHDLIDGQTGRGGLY